LHSESGRKAADVLLDVRNSGNDLIATMQQQGATAGEVAAKEAELRTSFLNAAGAMGIGRTEADKLANEILGIPSERETTINVNTAAAQIAIDGFINANTGKKVNLQVGVLNQLGAAVLGARPNAAGGYQRGPGTGTSDSILSFLSNGEFVVNARSTAQHRPLLEAINGAPGYANGGLVSPTFATPTVSGRSSVPLVSIGQYVAGGQSPHEVAEALAWMARTR
jgi:hypothetical protein